MTLQELATFAANATFEHIRKAEMQYGIPIPDVFQCAFLKAENEILAKAIAEQAIAEQQAKQQLGKPLAEGRPLGRLE